MQVHPAGAVAQAQLFRLQGTQTQLVGAGSASSVVAWSGPGAAGT